MPWCHLGRRKLIRIDTTPEEAASEYNTAALLKDEIEALRVVEAAGLKIQTAITLRSNKARISDSVILSFGSVSQDPPLTKPE